MAPTRTSIQVFSTGPLYAGYVTISLPHAPITISIGQIGSIEGFEGPQDWNNSNIFYTVIAAVQNIQNRGLELNYAQGQVNARASFSDGYDTGVFNFLQALVTYTINNSNNVSVYCGGNLGRTGLAANTYGNGTTEYNQSHIGAAPELDNSQLIGLFYNYNSGDLNIVPEVQYQYARPQFSLGIAKSTGNVAVAVFSDYSFGTSPYSIGAWVECFGQHESSEDAANGLYWFYGPNAAGLAISVTPTWQYKDLFARADFGGLALNRTRAYRLERFGYGEKHNASLQFTGFLEAGLLY